MAGKNKMDGKERGALLTAWLIWVIVTNLFFGVYYLLFNNVIMGDYVYKSGLSNAPSGFFYAFGVIGLANVIFAAFLFKWKKWAFFALCGTAGVVFIMNMAIALNYLSGIQSTSAIAGSFLGLLGPVILYLLLRSKWSLLE